MTNAAWAHLDVSDMVLTFQVPTLHLCFALALRACRRAFGIDDTFQPHTSHSNSMVRIPPGGFEPSTRPTRRKPIENHNKPEHNVTDTSITQPMSTGNVSSSYSDSDVGFKEKIKNKKNRILKFNSELRRSTRQSKPPDRLERKLRRTSGQNCCR
ncbi:hypothetical protein BpHYR1_004408 [Brachionus plicatilis]|uniref:Uncharacterized protein n=1 Tax=Brachionus plicatilis TaxID=10195 RepID=A0A3M7QLH7_BRAPC|nr:hypothetical protein BpHYR1_004408 [Brachionus plicatilis]